MNRVLLQKLAVDLARPFRRLRKLAIRQAVRGCCFEKDGMTQKARIAAVHALVLEIKRTRTRRFATRVWEGPSLQARFASWKWERVADVLLAVHFGRSATDHRIQVGFVDKPEEVRAEWSTVRGRSLHSFFVHRLWHSRVVQEGLTLLDGKITLHAEPVRETPSGVQVWEAVWACQGRGYSLSTRRGYIARLAGQHYHAGDPEAAVRGVRRRTRKGKGAFPPGGYQIFDLGQPGARVVFDGEGGFRVCLN